MKRVGIRLRYLGELFTASLPIQFYQFISIAINRVFVGQVSANLFKIVSNWLMILYHSQRRKNCYKELKKKKKRNCIESLKKTCTILQSHFPSLHKYFLKWKEINILHKIYNKNCKNYLLVTEKSACRVHFLLSSVWIYSGKDCEKEMYKDSLT